MSDEVPTPVPLSEEILAYQIAYDAGHIDWSDFSQDAIRLAARRLDEGLVASGQDPIHVRILQQHLNSQQAQQSYYYGRSGLLPRETEPVEYDPRRDVVRRTVLAEFGIGYTPKYLIDQLFTDHDKGHTRSRTLAVLDSALPQEYGALFFTDLLAWQSVAKVHRQYNAELDPHITSRVPTDKADEFWRNRVSDFNRYSGFAVRALMASSKQAENLFGNDGPRAMSAFRAITFLKKGVFHNAMTHRKSVIQALAEGRVDDAEAIVVDLVARNPTAFNGRALKMYAVK